MKDKKTLILAECGIMVALATVLSFIKVYEAPYGGSVTLMSMLPLIILSLRRGVKCGLASGVVYSLVQLLFGLSNVAWVPSAGGIVMCILFDYIIPFTLIGLAGIFAKNAKSRVKIIIAAVIGAVVVMLIRYLCHIFSGVVVWYALDLMWYADDPTHIVHAYGPWAFSAIYNGTFMLPEIVITAIGTTVCAASKMIVPEKK